MTAASGYSFGDSDLAAERLALLARVFEPVMRTFLLATVGRCCYLKSAMFLLDRI